MRGLPLTLTWVAFGMGVLCLALGLTTLLRRRVAVAWLQRRTDWRQFGWSQVLMSAYLLLETGPRLSNVSAEVLVGMSAIAFVPLIAAVVVMVRAPRHGP